MEQFDSPAGQGQDTGGSPDEQGLVARGRLRHDKAGGATSRIEKEFKLLVVFVPVNAVQAVTLADRSSADLEVMGQSERQGLEALVECHVTGAGREVGQQKRDGLGGIPVVDDG